MLSVTNLTLSFGKRILFEDVNLKFSPGNCYGLIGANGAGKSTLLKIISGELSPNHGRVEIGPNERLGILKQDQSAFDGYSVVDAVILGHAELYQVLTERNTIYSKGDFSEEDGMRAADLEEQLAEMNGYEAESEAAMILDGLGIADELHQVSMKDVEGALKVRILLAQAIFGNPDILLLDEPTNHLDMKSIRWLEEFLLNFNNTVIVVSHDRHFLNQVCTHTADIDYKKIKLYAGNYDFWYQSSQLLLQQKRDSNKKKEEKVKELQEFIQRFSSNASKAKQATSRKKILDKIKLDDMGITSRKFPYIHFVPERECGKSILSVENLSHTLEGEVILKNFNLVVNQGDKIGFVASNHLMISTLFQILSGEIKPESGTITWGTTITHSYFPSDNTKYFEEPQTLVNWLRQYSKDQEENFIRGFLGRMLFSGEEALKKTNVLSGGERVRCMLSKMMLSGANVMMLDGPTNHLDLESITSLNVGLQKFSEVLFLATHDYELMNTVVNRVIEITPHGVIDEQMSYDEYWNNTAIEAQRTKLLSTPS